jgi:hypothetical protein
MWTGKVNQVSDSTEDFLQVSLDNFYPLSVRVSRRRLPVTITFRGFSVSGHLHLRAGEFAFPPKPSESNRNHEVKTLEMYYKPEVYVSRPELTTVRISSETWESLLKV